MSSPTSTYRLQHRHRSRLLALQRREPLVPRGRTLRGTLLVPPLPPLRLPVALRQSGSVRYTSRTHPGSYCRGPAAHQSTWCRPRRRLRRAAPPLHGSTRRLRAGAHAPRRVPSRAAPAPRPTLSPRAALHAAHAALRAGPLPAHARARTAGRRPSAALRRATAALGPALAAAAATHCAAVRRTAAGMCCAASCPHLQSASGTVCPAPVRPSPHSSGRSGARRSTGAQTAQSTAARPR